LVVNREIPESPGNTLAASAGMTAVVLAHLAGGQIFTSGFDFLGGHFHTMGTRRGHTIVDKEIAGILSRQHVR